MTLSSVREGDIVQADGIFYRVVALPERGQITGEELCGAHCLRRLKARQVEAHWKRMGK